jgi:uncharacterized protein YycO
MYRAAVEGFDTADLTGDQLVHYDLHPGNLKVTADADVAAVDWAFACAGAPYHLTALQYARSTTRSSRMMSGAAWIACSYR